MIKPYAVVFAGVPGSSKSIIAYYLSGEFGLPIFSTDNIRFEVREDLKVHDINIPYVLKEYELRSKERRERILSYMRPVIFDGSVDRRWNEIKKSLDRHDYDYFLIAVNLSKEFLVDLYQSTGRPKAVLELDAYLKQHNDFMSEYGHVANVIISDDSFIDRCKNAAINLDTWLKNRE